MIDAGRVHETLSRHQLVDGYPMVFDMEASHGIWLRDGRTGDEYLDVFTNFASWPVGYAHPRMQEPGFQQKLLGAALNNPANSDLYTQAMAEFVEDFATHVTPPGFPHHFWVAGGALAVENALKTAFDWKARKLGRTTFDADCNDLSVLHFRQAFHGRSGYTMSLTNTVPAKTGLFPKFDWPRAYNPAVEFDLDGNVMNDIEAEEARACADIERAFAERGDTIAAILIEPLQGEGGDNHFRPEFLAKLRAYADEREAMLIFDEVQTGFFGSGKPWLWQTKDVRPDIVAFGKKTQVCGIYASERVDEVEDNVFALGSRINSTWGGNLTDMVRCRKFIEIVREDGLADNIAARGAQLVDGLRALAGKNGTFGNVRGVGSLVAFTLPTAEERGALLDRLMGQKLMALAAGQRSIRFRLPLIISADEVGEVLKRVAAGL